MDQPRVFNAATSQLCHGAAITNPTGGSVVDVQARAALVDTLAALRAASIIAGATSVTGAGLINPPTQALALMPAISNPAGGTVVDSQLRAAVAAVLTVLRARNVVVGGTGAPAFIFDEDTFALTAAAIANVTGGTTVDAEARVALNAALIALRSAGFIAKD